MRVDLFGGFHEKGRTALGIATEKLRLLFDAGIKIGAEGEDYHPRIDAETAQNLDALFISHAHEDHIGALPWLMAQGFKGRIFMTPETLAETPETLKNYALPQDLERFPLPVAQVELFHSGDEIRLGDVVIKTGRSGHVAGGVWFSVSNSIKTITYSGDVVPDSVVLPMDPLPVCDLLVLDASYGADLVSGEQRARDIRDWILHNRDGCLLPTPLSGRSLELMALCPTGFAIHASMRQPLKAQLSVADHFDEAMRQKLLRSLSQAQDWTEDQALPRCPLLTDDGMGRAGPSAYAMTRAMRTGWPVLLTGHVPPGTLAFDMLLDELADWIRLPTHPTLSGMTGLWEQAGKPMVIGHSATPALLAELSDHIPTLRRDLSVGDHWNLGEA